MINFDYTLLAYVLLGFMLALMLLATWRRLSRHPSLPRLFTSEAFRHASKQSPAEVLRRHYLQGHVTRAAYEDIRRSLARPSPQAQTGGPG